MQEVAYKEHTTSQGAYTLIRDMDNNIRKINNTLYISRHETKHDLSEVKKGIATLEEAEAKHDKSIDILKNDAAELKGDVKEIRRDISEIKGDIKALAAGFGAAQNRFNWGLVILGIIVALIQLLK